jgi:hypothetical protein
MGLLSKAAFKTTPLVSPLDVTNGINAYRENNPAFQGVVLEIPDTCGSSVDFAEVLAGVTAALGTTLPLPSRFCLVLVPGDFDRELLIHRLTGSLKIKAVFQFKANSPDEAMQLLHTYL